MWQISYFKQLAFLTDVFVIFVFNQWVEKTKLKSQNSDDFFKCSIDFILNL